MGGPWERWARHTKREHSSRQWNGLVWKKGGVYKSTVVDKENERYLRGLGDRKVGQCQVIGMGRSGCPGLQQYGCELDSELGNKG